MPEYENSADGEATGGTADRMLIVVVRSGGFAGISRRWRVTPDPDEQPRWTTLVERCPWDAPEPDADAGADRFTWTVHARVPDAELQRELPESRLTGAWRELIDAVRESGERVPGPTTGRSPEPRSTQPDEE